MLIQSTDSIFVRITTKNSYKYATTPNVLFNDKKMYCSWLVKPYDQEFCEPHFSTAIGFEPSFFVLFVFTLHLFLMSDLSTFSGASCGRTISTSMQSADYTRGDETLLNAAQQFDLNSALYNSLTNNIKTCRYLETNSPFPISTQNKSLFL